MDRTRHGSVSDATPSEIRAGGRAAAMMPARQSVARTCIALACLALIAEVASAQTITGTVVAVHDGDTISIRTTRDTIRIRLAGIDCPEYRQPFSARAKQFTSRLVFRKTVTVRSNGTDRFDRLLGRVFVDGIDVNEALVRNGLAWHYEIGDGDRALADAEAAARLAKAGLWADRNPVPPWRWRRDVASDSRAPARR